MNSLKFEFLTCILVFYDCFMVPFKYTFGAKNFFDERTALILDIIDYTIKFVFGIDVILGFRKAYLKEKSGQEVRNPKQIAWRYIKFYFWIDLLSAMPFDLFIKDMHE